MCCSVKGFLICSVSYPEQNKEQRAEGYSSPEMNFHCLLKTLVFFLFFYTYCTHKSEHTRKHTQLDMMDVFASHHHSVCSKERNGEKHFLLITFHLPLPHPPLLSTASIFHLHHLHHLYLIGSNRLTHSCLNKYNQMSSIDCCTLL